ncbi:MAG: hypothetical protein OEY33_02565 [Bdellovibrionales bacterium]|jgi:hypothetical protein|nr:hypothetical protein [Bdellovibrionales bacterium]
MKKRLILISLLLQVLISPLMAQDEGAAGNLLKESVQDIYTVVGVGVGGAIIGLSTLSFAEHPKDNLKNIVIGGAIGVILGVGIVAYKHATETQDVYNEYSMKPSKYFSTEDRLAIHSFSFNKYMDQKPMQIGYKFSF